MRWGRGTLGRESSAFRKSCSKKQDRQQVKLYPGLVVVEVGREWGGVLQGQLGAGSGQRENNKQWVPFKDPAKNNNLLYSFKENLFDPVPPATASLHHSLYSKSLKSSFYLLSQFLPSHSPLRIPSNQDFAPTCHKTLSSGPSMTLTALHPEVNFSI